MIISCSFVYELAVSSVYRTLHLCLILAYVSLKFVSLIFLSKLLSKISLAVVYCVFLLAVYLSESMPNEAILVIITATMLTQLLGALRSRQISAGIVHLYQWYV